MKAIEILKTRLLGTHLSRFSVGDAWDLKFGDYWISAQNVVSKDEKVLNDYLQGNYPPFQNTVDQEYISKCAVIATCMQKVLVDLNLDDNCSLILDFQDDRQLVLTTDTSIVDWQWSLSEDGAIPYTNYIVACFWQGEVEINQTKLK